jgi:hypothetical protein
MRKKNISLLTLAMLALFVVNPLRSFAAPTTVKTVDVKKQVFYSAEAFKGASDTLNLTEVATALGTDTATLAKSTDFLYATDIDGNQTNVSTANAPGFWFDKDGKVTKYGSDSTCIYTEVHVDAPNNRFIIAVGTYPRKDSVYTTYNATLYAVAADKQMQINVALTVVPKPVVVVDWTKVDFVKTIDVAIEQYPAKNWGTSDVAIKLSDVALALGTDTTTLINAAKEGIVYAKDTLGYSSHYTQDPSSVNNFWLSTDGKIANYGTNKADGTPYYTWYMWNTFQAAGDSLIFSVGQLPNHFAADSVATLQEYILYNNKAVTINLTLKVIAQPVIDWNHMTETGTYTFSIEKNKNDGYDATAIDLDAADIASKLGIDVSTLKNDAKLFAIDAGGGQSDAYTADAPGFWFNQQGVVCSWGAQAYMYVDYKPADALFNIGYYAPNSANFVDGDECSADLYIAYGDKYVKVTVNVTVAKTPVIPPVTEKPEVSATYAYPVQVIPADSYDVPTKVTVDLNEAAKALGEDVKTFIQNMGVYTVDTLDNMTNKYTCAPNPGFWFNKDSKNIAWGANAYVGCTYATDGENGVFTFYQYPNRNKVGDAYPLQMWLVDPVLKKAVVYTLTMSFVESIHEMKEVGGTDISIALLPTDADSHKLPINFTDVATAFGIPSADLKSSTTSYPITLYAKNANGILTSAMTSDYGYWMTKKGAICNNSDDSCSFGLSYYGISTAATQDFDNVEVTVWGDVANGDQLKGTVYLGIQSDDIIKLYACNVTIYISDDPASVKTVGFTNTKTGNVYDLSGRLVRQNTNSLVGLRKGVYLFNGKKYVVK